MTLFLAITASLCATWGTLIMAAVCFSAGRADRLAENFRRRIPQRRKLTLRARPGHTTTARRNPGRALSRGRR